MVPAIADPPIDTSVEKTVEDKRVASSSAPAGPQVWAAVVVLAAAYYLWKRVGGRRVGGVGIGEEDARKGRDEMMMAARERQQRQLVSRQRDENDDDDNDNDANTHVLQREDSTSVENRTPTKSINERMRLLKERREEDERLAKLEEKKKTQRMLYLKQRAIEEEEEAMRRKDDELGPGWRYREDPNAVMTSNNNNNNSIGGMNPQGGCGGGGEYKPQARKRRGG